MDQVGLILIEILLLIGVLSWNPTLNEVALTRQSQAVTYPVRADPQGYDCLLGVPHGYGYLIDREVFIRLESGRLVGPYLVVDVEAPHHAPHMARSRLAADINCPHLVHRRAEVVLILW